MTDAELDEIEARLKVVSLPAGDGRPEWSEIEIMDAVVQAPVDAVALLAEVRRLRALCDRIVTDRVNDSDLAQEAVRRERERVAKTYRSGAEALAAYGAGPCQYADCDGRPATAMAAGIPTFTDVGFYCEAHAKMAANNNFPEYIEACPNCGCWFGVN